MNNMIPINEPNRRASYQRGVSMVVTMLMIIVVASMAAVSARFALSGERSGRGDRDREVAFQAAEAALNDAARDIVGPIPPATTTSTRFNSFCPSAINPGGSGFPNVGEPLCNLSPDDLGKCALKQAESLPSWLSVDWDRDGVPIGKFTGNVAFYPTGTTTWLPLKVPRYIIEPVPESKKDQSNSITERSVSSAARSEEIKWLYQITAIGYGANPETKVVLQQTIRKDAGNCALNNELGGGAPPT
jgi:type IV pilus assembly protein PilX